MCPKCLSKNTKKIVKRNEIQRYQCNNCGKKF
ncbi:transposase-like zinc-binding domain-containing protein [Aliarcobacter butzleri]